MHPVATIRRLTLTACAAAALPGSPSLAHAEPAAALAGLYAGAAIGRAEVASDELPYSVASPGLPTVSGSFREGHGAWELYAGLRPISLLGAELDYVDLGRPGTSQARFPASAGLSFPVAAAVRMRGGAAFGVLYLPVPVIDVYLKAGLARLQTSATTTLTVPGPYAACVVTGGPHCQFSRTGDITTTDLAIGAGLQYRLGPVALRGEYQRFGAAGAHPEIVALGVSWSFR